MFVLIGRFEAVNVCWRRVGYSQGPYAGQQRPSIIAPFFRISSHQTAIANKLFIYTSRCRTYSTWVAHLTKPVSCRWIFTGLPFLVLSSAVGRPGLTRLVTRGIGLVQRISCLSTNSIQFNSIQFLYETKSQNFLSMYEDPEYHVFLLFSYLFIYFRFWNNKYIIYVFI